MNRNKMGPYNESRTGKGLGNCRVGIEMRRFGRFYGKRRIMLETGEFPYGMGRRHRGIFRNSILSSASLGRGFGRRGR